MFKHGARKVALNGLRPLGCIPREIATYGTNGSNSSCVDTINEAVQLFNPKVRALVDDLNANLADAKFIFLNIYAIASEASSLGKLN